MIGCMTRQGRNDNSVNCADEGVARARTIGIKPLALTRMTGCHPGSLKAFTLIELLVVISIIALLASLTVGLSGVAGRKSKESRIKADLNKLITAIDGYIGAIGSPPRDNPGKPSTNQLFYELTGTIFENGQFHIPSRTETISPQAISTFFNAPGFGNSVRPGDNLKFSHEFRASEYKEISSNPDIEILIVPVKGPSTFTTANGTKAPLPITAADKTVVNPWLYDCSSPNRNNNKPNGFDLWTEVVIGNKIIRFSNWEKDPVVIGSTR
jgi:prepilin-type N-terminal cleavage/methylation domain-containing protein